MGTAESTEIDASVRRGTEARERTCKAVAGRCSCASAFWGGSVDWRRRHHREPL